MFDRTDDTIVAISSPPGISLRGIVRLSGPDALKWGQQLFEAHEGPPLTQSPGHRRHFGRVRLEGSATVPAEAWIFRAPASYTRQDMLELHLPGSPPVLTIIHDALTARGARPAEPGEFTARAYFSGALDLTRVEGVAALIHARNDSQLRASHALLTGTLSRRSIELRDRLADLLSVLEAQIDFVEESIEFVTTGQAGSVVGEVAAELDELLGAADSVERLEALPVVMLVGRPNAGKSTLFNRLTGVDRAIQSATAGTTRDVLSMPLM
ncbi:MAG: tRNA modification GTPase MnmE, partial [Phycisphaerae bacterium]